MLSRSDPIFRVQLNVLQKIQTKKRSNVCLRSPAIRKRPFLMLVAVEIEPRS